MKYVKIGKSSIYASVITLGGLSIGGGSWWRETEDDVSVKTIRAALDLGVNIIDTAPIYGLGHSEEVIGKAIQGYRDKVVLSTKATFNWDTGIGRFWKELDGHKVYVDHSYNGIVTDCENSLRRLKTDYIDIYYLHNPAKDPVQYPVAEQVRAMSDLKKQGKIRVIGLSNAQPEQVENYLAHGLEIEILQRKYSILQRDVESTLLPLCRKYVFSFHAYEPLERGLFTGTISRDYQLKPGESRNDSKWWLEDRLVHAIDFVDSLKDIAEKYNAPLLDLAIAYLRGNGEFVNVICGARKPEQIKADAAAAELILEEKDVNEIRRRADALDERLAANS
jgi:methylglyoxal reductase